MSSVTLFHNAAVMNLHDPPDAFPENPARLLAVERVLRQSGLWDTCENVCVDTAISRDEIVAVYGERVVEKMSANIVRVANKGPFHCGDIYWTANTMTASAIAANAAIAATESVLAKGGAAFALIRPPGHHCFNVPAGFCILNNVVFATRAAQKAGKRVAILDWDYHFGDGTAETVKTMEDVMFVSLHCMRNESGSATYPHSKLKGSQLAKETGGRCFNVAWQTDDADDAALAFALTRLILPALERFAPDVLLISAGYDALRGDDLAGMELTPAVFRAATSALRTLGLPVVAVLEGGYNVDLLAEGVAETVYGMLDTPSRAEIETLAASVQNHHKVLVETVAEHNHMCTGSS
jgi:histone deacetylase 6